jgi:hypothetical protein
LRCSQPGVLGKADGWEVYHAEIAGKLDDPIKKLFSKQQISVHLPWLVGSNFRRLNPSLRRRADS